MGPALRLISSIFYFGLPNNIDLKSRYKSHFGESIELRYQLQGYGIPVDLLPLTFTGVVKTTYHSQCVKFRKKLEQAQVQHAKEKQQLRESSMSTSLHSTVSNSSHNMWIQITDIQRMREKVAQSYKVYAKQQRRFSL